MAASCLYHNLRLLHRRLHSAYAGIPSALSCSSDLYVRKNALLKKEASAAGLIQLLKKDKQKGLIWR